MNSIGHIVQGIAQVHQGQPRVGRVRQAMPFYLTLRSHFSRSKVA
jgi:hypothetical protein